MNEEILSGDLNALINLKEARHSKAALLECKYRPLFGSYHGFTGKALQAEALVMTPAWHSRPANPLHMFTNLCQRRLLHRNLHGAVVLHGRGTMAYQLACSFYRCEAGVAVFRPLFTHQPPCQQRGRREAAAEYVQRNLKQDPHHRPTPRKHPHPHHRTHCWNRFCP